MEEQRGVKVVVLSQSVLGGSVSGEVRFWVSAHFAG